MPRRLRKLGVKWSLQRYQFPMSAIWSTATIPKVTSSASWSSTNPLSSVMENKCLEGPDSDTVLLASPGLHTAQYLCLVVAGGDYVRTAIRRRALRVPHTVRRQRVSGFGQDP